MYGGQIIVGSVSPLDWSNCPPETSVSSEVRKAPYWQVNRPHPVLTQVNRNASIPAENVEIGPPKPARSQLAQDKQSVPEVVAFQGRPAYFGPENGIFLQAGFPPFNTVYN
jgi:hypothetical protein